MTDINNLFARIRYPAGSDLPIVMLIHGWSSNADVFTEAQLSGLTAQGLFVCVPGMRGRNGADGAQDASGKEVYDIYDALQQVRSTYSSIVSPDKAAIVGFSSGGGNALAAACKFPDTWSLVVSHFGISDYGRDGTDGWYYNNGAGAYTASIVAAVGDTPANVPNKYYARDATAAIQNYTGGHLYLFHDDGDTVVPIVHSQRIGAVMLAAGLENYTENYTSAVDSPRWTHGNYLSTTESIWVTPALSNSAWTVPESGTMTVIGHQKTKRFEIVLSGYDDSAATVVYDTTTDTYTVTPLVSGIDVTITQGAKTGSATNISAETIIVVS